MVLLALAVLAGIWEGYKALAPEDGVSIFGVRILPRASDAAMPHISAIFGAFRSQEVSLAGSQSVLSSVIDAALTTLRYAGVGFAIGVVIGFLLALVMDALPMAERALLPYVVLSQTVPLIALAPLVTGWGSDLSLGPLDWQPWMSVSVIAAYLAFFPVAIGALRGLKSPTAAHAEYFRCTAAGRWRTLIRLKLPASVPFLIPALRLAAAAAVVGTIVAEISTGLRGGIGRLIISYAQQATGDPARVYTAVIGAALLGLLAAALVSLLDLALRRYHRSEVMQ
jgi:NitT/TauT family transport system permease protein